MRIKNILYNIIKNSLQSLNINYDIKKININKKIIDNCEVYTTNIAIILSKYLHKKPEEIANILKCYIKGDIIENIEIVYPGMIIIYLNKKYLLNNIYTIIKENINYGSNDIGKDKKINITLSKENLYEKMSEKDILKIIYCDNLYRIYNKMGFSVKKDYYINNKIDTLIINEIKENYINICNNDIIKNSEYTNISTQLYSYYKNIKINDNDKYFNNEISKCLISNLIKEIDVYRMNFDNIIIPEELLDFGLVDNTLNKLNRTNCTYFEDNSLYLSIDIKNKIYKEKLIDENGNYTKFLYDITYYLEKIDNNHGIIIITYTKEEIYFSIIKEILKLLNKDFTKIVINYIDVDNNIIKLNDEINDIRLLANNKDIKLDINKINDINNKINILLKNKNMSSVQNFSTLACENVYTILNKLYDFEEIINLSGFKQTPYLINNYLSELLDVTEKYLNKETIITDEIQQTNENLNFLLAIKIVINNTLDLIGIIPRD